MQYLKIYKSVPKGFYFKYPFPFSYWTGVTDCVEFQQSPSHILAEDGSKMDILCSHDDSALIYMLWYRQHTGTTVMTLIGHGHFYGDQNYESGFSKDQVNIKRDGVLKGSLALSHLNSSDSAVYFCAASSTVLQVTPTPSLKTLIPHEFNIDDSVKYSFN